MQNTEIKNQANRLRFNLFSAENFVNKALREKLLTNITKILNYNYLVLYEYSEVIIKIGACAAAHRAEPSVFIIGLVAHEHPQVPGIYGIGFMGKVGG